MTLEFRKQPGGQRGIAGRGEYELSGESNGHDVASLNGCGFILETPFGQKETDLILSNQGGKRRLRLTTGNGIQIARQAAAILLLPEVTRTESATSNALPIVLTKRYLLDLRVELTSVNSGMAIVRPTEAVARSGTNDEKLTVHIPTAERFRTIERVLSQREELPDSVGKALGVIADLLGQRTIGLPLEKAIKGLQEALEDVSPEYLPGSDPIPYLASLLGFGEAPDVPIPPEMPRGDNEIRLKSEFIYRLRRARGRSADTFRKKVQRAYDYRCLFCGLRAPAPRRGATPGVDAAHILPWGEYDLDVVQNGMILCKQHHWAFDNHLLIFGFQKNRYHVDLLLDGTEGYVEDAQTVEELSRVCGQIPLEHLPTKMTDRPDPVFIERLYS